MAVAPGNGDVYVLVCLCTRVELAVCCGLFFTATAGCSLRVFIPFLIPPWGFASVHRLVHVSGTALWGTMEVVVLKWFFISWGMFLESWNQTLPADMDCLGSPPTCCGSEVASHGFAQAQEGCWPCGFILAVPISPLTSFLCSQDQYVGWVCLMGTQEQTLWTAPAVEPRDAAVEAFYSIYPGLQSALQLLLTQINVFFLSLYFLQSWHIAVLQSVGAVLSLELRNTFSPWFPGNSRPPHHCICYNDYGSSVPQHLSCVGSLSSPVSLFHVLFSFHFYCLYFPPFSSFSFLSDKNCCCMCTFQTSFQPY